MKKKVLVIFSGGQDSTTCLIHCMNLYKEVHCITFNYYQAHNAEINSAILIAKKLHIKNHIIIDLKDLKDMSISSLTKKDISIYDKHPMNSSLPSTFVPGRNILFLVFSSIYAYQNKINSVVLGVNQIDFSGYPDCRNEFIKKMNDVINIGITCNIKFITPLMHLNKAEIWALSAYWNASDIILHDTITCYNGIAKNGCGQCHACSFRKEGFKKWKNNPLYYMKNMKEKMKL